MAHVSVEIPAALVPPLRDTVVLLYQATAEALHFALQGQDQRSGPLEEVHQHRARLAQLGAILDRLGWPLDQPPDGLELDAPRDVLHDALHGALIDTGERLASACEGNWRGEVEPESVRALATEVIELDGLLRSLPE